MIVRDLLEGVRAKLGDRLDVDDKIPRWVKAAILELTTAYRFEELIVKGPTLAFSVNKAEYDRYYFTTDHEPATDIVSWFIQLDSVTGVGYELKYRTNMVVEPLAAIPGTPVYWTRTGRTLLVGCKPAVGYTTYQRYQKLHPFSAEIINDVIMMPDDWEEIITYSAALRGAHEERMNDYAQYYHQVLYGDPEVERSQGIAGRGSPGIIKRKLTQMTRDMAHNERQMQPVVSRY